MKRAPLVRPLLTLFGASAGRAFVDDMSVERPDALVAALRQQPAA
jgi:hypothetical protein